MTGATPCTCRTQCASTNAHHATTPVAVPVSPARCRRRRWNQRSLASRSATNATPCTCRTQCASTNAHHATTPVAVPDGPARLRRRRCNQRSLATHIVLGVTPDSRRMRRGTTNATSASYGAAAGTVLLRRESLGIVRRRIAARREEDAARRWRRERGTRAATAQGRGDAPAQKKRRQTNRTRRVATIIKRGCGY